MNFVFFTDAHLSDTAPASRTDNYTDEILKKLYEVSDICRRVKASYALFGGDWFNSKVAAKISHSLVNKSLNVIDSFPCPIIWILGSHDVSYGRIDSIEKRPIGIILKHPKVIFIDDAYEIDIPNLSNVPLRARFLPVSDTYNTYKEVVDKVSGMMSKPDQDFISEGGIYYNIALLHQPIARSREKVPYEVMYAVDLVGYADMLLYGHMHKYEGTWEETGYFPDESDNDVELKLLVNGIGSISRNTIDRYEHNPGVFIFGVNYINNEIKINHQEHFLTEVKAKEEVFKAPELVETDIDIKEFMSQINKVSFGLFTKEKAIEVIQNFVESNLDKSISIETLKRVKCKAVEILEKCDY